MHELYVSLFVLDCVFGGFNPKTEPWKTYALCSHHVLPIEEARMHYGRSFTHLNYTHAGHIAKVKALHILRESH
jgi:hypothetical protein